MEDSKPWYQSRSVLTGAVAVVAAVAGYFGLSIGDVDQADIVEKALMLSSAVSGALSVWFRITAKKVLTA